MIDTNDKIDKELMNIMQSYFPLSRQPFDDIGKRLGLTEKETISRLRKLSEKGFIRKVGAIISARDIGFVSLLAAVSVPEEKVDKVAEIINTYPGVTHNYLRSGNPNIWFTLIEPDQETLEKNLTEIENKVKTKVYRLPAKKIYKIGVKFDIK